VDNDAFISEHWLIKNIRFDRLADARSWIAWYFPDLWRDEWGVRKRLGRVAETMTRPKENGNADAPDAL
jgi:hypothetical protein